MKGKTGLFVAIQKNTGVVRLQSGEIHSVDLSSLATISGNETADMQRLCILAVFSEEGRSYLAMYLFALPFPSFFGMI